MRLRDLASYLFLAIAWGFSFLLLLKVVAAFGWVGAVTFRCFIAAAILILMARLTRRRLVFPARFMPLAVVGATTVAGQLIGLSYATPRIGTAMALDHRALQAEEAGDQLQAVLHAVVHLAHEHLLLDEEGLAVGQGFAQAQVQVAQAAVLARLKQRAAQPGGGLDLGEAPGAGKSPSAPFSPAASSPCR